MINIFIPVCLSLLASCSKPGNPAEDFPWQSEIKGKCCIYYRSAELNHLDVYRTLITAGLDSAKAFWGKDFPEAFDLYIHPSRSSMDSAWQEAWGFPGFRSECWMVASGVADRMDLLLSPIRWEEEACEHSFRQKDETRKLILHELIHVFHGQCNPSPDFSETEGIEWFIEGLATYASGQCDESRMIEVLEAVNSGQIPASLDELWKGDLRYGLSGSMLMYMDRRFGRSKLMKLMGMTCAEEILSDLQLTSEHLLSDWFQFMQSLYAK